MRYRVRGSFSGRMSWTVRRLRRLTATTEGLADPSHTKTVRRTDGGVVATDGPYAEVKEVLVSYAILDCASHERVMEIAARVCDAVGDTVEVRPIGSGPGPF